MVPKLNSENIILSKEIFLIETMPLYRDSQTFIVKIRIIEFAGTDTRESV